MSSSFGLINTAPMPILPTSLRNLSFILISPVEIARQVPFYFILFLIILFSPK